MTREDAIAQVAIVTQLSEADVAGFLACSDSEREAILIAYRNAGTLPGPSAWSDALDILRGCAELAGMVLPLTTLLGAVIGFTKP